MSAVSPSCRTTKPCRTYSARAGFGARDAETHAARLGRAAARDQRTQQQTADARAPELRIDRDRELGDVGRDEAVSGCVGREVPAPRGADRLLLAIERDERDVSRTAPVLDVARVVRVGDHRVEGRPFLTSVVVPVDGLVQHLDEELRIGARATNRNTCRA